jgi:hypothetical protein
MLEPASRKEPCTLFAYQRQGGGFFFATRGCREQRTIVCG